MATVRLTTANVRKALVQDMTSAVKSPKEFTMRFSSQRACKIAWEFLTGHGQNDICAVLDRWLRDGKGSE